MALSSLLTTLGPAALELGKTVLPLILTEAAIPLGKMAQGLGGKVGQVAYELVQDCLQKYTNTGAASTSTTTTTTSAATSEDDKAVVTDLTGAAVDAGVGSEAISKTIPELSIFQTIFQKTVVISATPLGWIGVAAGTGLALYYAITRWKESTQEQQDEEVAIIVALIVALTTNSFAVIGTVYQWLLQIQQKIRTKAEEQRGCLLMMNTISHLLLDFMHTNDTEKMLTNLTKMQDMLLEDFPGKSLIPTSLIKQIITLEVLIESNAPLLKIKQIISVASTIIRGIVNQHIPFFGSRLEKLLKLALKIVKTRAQLLGIPNIGKGPKVFPVSGDKLENLMSELHQVIAETPTGTGENFLDRANDQEDGFKLSDDWNLDVK